MGFYVRGISEIQRAFNELGEKQAPKIIKKAEREGLKPIRKSVQQAAPVGTGPSEIPHGTIRKFVKITPGKKKKNRFDMTVNIKFKREANEPYWAFAREAKDHFMENVFESDGDKAKNETINFISLGTSQAIKQLGLNGN